LDRKALKTQSPITHDELPFIRSSEKKKEFPQIH